MTAVPVLICLSLVGGQLPSFSRPAGRHLPATRRGALEWAARREGSRIPSLAEVCAFVMRYEAGPLPVGRIVLLGFWWWLGWHFLARRPAGSIDLSASRELWAACGK